MAKNVAELESERLILRGITEDDAPEIVEWRSDPEAYKFFRSPHRITMDEHLAWFRNRYLSNDDRFDWMCFEKSSGSKIGVFGSVVLRLTGGSSRNQLHAQARIEAQGLCVGSSAENNTVCAL